MADLSYTVEVNTNQAQRALANLDKQTEQLSGAFSTLKGALAGLAIGAFVNNLVESAKAIQDIAGSTGFATQTIIGLQRAFIANGGSAEIANNAIAKFTQTVGEAAQGSAELQSAFSQIGISLDDLATLSEEELFDKTIKGLANLSDNSQRASLGLRLLGKAAKTVDFTGVANTQDAYIAGAKEQAQAVIAADEASKKLEEALEEIKKALFTISEPLSEFILNINIGSKAIANFVKTVGTILLVIASITLVGKAIRGLIILIGALGKAPAAIIVGLKSLRTTFQRIIEQFGRFKKAGEVTQATLTGLTKRFEWLKKGADLIGQGVGALTALFATVFAIALPEKFSRLLTIIGEKIGLVKTESEKLLEAMNKQSAEAHKAAREQKARAEKELEAARKVTDALIQKRLAIKNIADAYKDQLDASRLAIENERIGLLFSEKNAEIINKVNELEEQRATILERLNDELKKVGQGEESVAAEIRKNIDLVNELTEDEKTRVITALTGLQSEKEAIEAKNRAIEFGKQLFDDQLELEAMRAEIAMLAMTQEEREEYQKLLQIEQELKRALMEIDMEAARVGKEATDSQIEDWERRRQAAIDYADKVKEINADEKKARDDQRTQIEVWSKETQKSLEESLKPSSQIKKFWEGLSSQIDEFVKTGKFKIKDFLLSMVQEFLATQMKLAALKLFQTIFGSIGGIPLPGRSAGGSVQKGQPYMVGERGAEMFIPSQNGNIVPNNQLTKQEKAGPIVNNYNTYNISAIDAKSVAQLFAENRKTLLGTVRMAERELPYAMG